MEWREIMPPVVKPDNVDPKIAHETLLEIIAERKAREGTPEVEAGQVQHYETSETIA